MTDMTGPHGLETKSARDADIADAFGEFMTTFEAFKASNEEKLADIDRRLGADVVTTDKVERISTALDEQKRRLDDLALKRLRPPLGDGGRRAAPSEHKAASMPICAAATSGRCARST
jgi:predicted phage gp36 major capsid-like protein